MDGRSGRGSVSRAVFGVGARGGVAACDSVAAINFFVWQSFLVGRTMCRASVRLGVLRMCNVAPWIGFRAQGSVSARLEPYSKSLSVPKNFFVPLTTFLANIFKSILCM